MAEVSPAVIPNTEIRRIQSKLTGQAYQIFVGFPNDYTTLEKPLPVLYMLDANLCFGVLEFLRLMQSFQEVPAFLVVGIGYAVEHFLDTVKFRERDYTPTVKPQEKAGTSSPPAVAEPSKTGQAFNFLHFLREELLPFIEGTYRVDPSDRAIHGVSLGGLFAFYTLFHQPDTFSRYIICSPSLWWDGGITFTYENEYAAAHSDLKAKVFLSAGSLDGTNIKEDVLQLSERLRQKSYAGFALTTHIFPDETHVSGIAAAVCRGASVVYGT